MITKLFSVTLPEFNTVPLKVSNPPGEVAVGGQICVSTTAGVVTKGHNATAVFVIESPLFRSVPTAVSVSETEQTLSGVR